MKLSLCMPTWNRAQMLDYTLGHVLAEYGDHVEVVVADNSSTDNTSEVVESHQSKLHIRYIRHKEVPPYLGQVIAMRTATCPYIAFMADDDWVLPNIWEYVEQLESRPELSAVYSDLMAWDDESERELHRYFYLDEPREFDRSQPLGLVEFVCTHLIYPEIGVFRRDAFLRSDVLISRGNLPNHLWMYRMSRLGTVRFEKSDSLYYREHRVVKSRFQRTPTSNLTGRMNYIGDEFRNVLETMMLWALRDAGLPYCTSPFELEKRQLIEQFLHRRLQKPEIGRAFSEGNFLLATELTQRLKLWTGNTLEGDGEAQLRWRAIAQHVGIMESCGVEVDPSQLTEHYRV